MAKKLGTIKEFDLRDIFKDEARDFTPWLAKEENLKILSDEIGVEIGLVQIEANVGRYNVDILAEEEGSGRKIIIENQLDPTNHGHLGQLITYAAGHDAAIIIWIFGEVKEEHRQAIDWLNEHTDEETAFFAIKMELWQIDDSSPAPKFNIIASPNEWAKTIKHSSGNIELTDTKLQQLEFWTKFKAHVIEHDHKIRLQTPRPQHWYDVSMGTSEAHVALTVNTRDNLMACEIYISRNKELFNFLKDKADVIEKEIGQKLEWVEASVASRIKVIYKNFDISDQNQYGTYYAWLYEQTILFQKIFGKYIKAYKK
ncbi:DUF4268 domain-containing protein [Candidatus Margulisiibacteriota bacterium]